MISNNFQVLRLVWEGDHLSPPQKLATEKLVKWERKKNSLVKRVESAEIEAEAAALDTVDEGTATFSPKFKNELSSLSHDLDVAASAVDSILISDGVGGRPADDCPDGRLRWKKKRLSREIVEFMRRVDAIISKIDDS